MALQLGDIAPTRDRIHRSPIQFHNGWAIPGAFSFASEEFHPDLHDRLGYAAKLKPEFDKRNVKVIGLSVDELANHSKWAEDIKGNPRHRSQFPGHRRSTAQKSRISMA